MGGRDRQFSQMLVLCKLDNCREDSKDDKFNPCGMTSPVSILTSENSLYLERKLHETDKDRGELVEKFKWVPDRNNWLLVNCLDVFDKHGTAHNLSLKA